MIVLALESYAEISGEAMIEAVAMYVRGWVVWLDKDSYKIQSGAAEYRVTSRSTTEFIVDVIPSAEDVAGLKTELFCLWMGLHRAGISIVCDDELVQDFPKSSIPSRAKLHKMVTFRRLFMDDYVRYWRDWQVPHRMLLRIHKLFARTPTLAALQALVINVSDANIIHPVINYEHYKIEVQTIDGVILAHRLFNYTPDDPVMSDGQLTDVQLRRSWGEVWIPYMANLVFINGLMSMGDQVAVVTDRIERFQVADAGSLRRRHQLILGAGVSPSYSYQDWLTMAEQLTESGQLPSARKCLAQAKLQCVTKEDSELVTNLQASINKTARVPIPFAAAFVHYPFSEVRSRVKSDFWQKLLNLEIDRARGEGNLLAANYVLPVKGVRSGIADVARAVAGGLCEQALINMTGWPTTQMDSEPQEDVYSTEIDDRLVVFGSRTAIYFVEGCPNCVFHMYARHGECKVT